MDIVHTYYNIMVRIHYGSIFNNNYHAFSILINFLSKILNALDTLSVYKFYAPASRKTYFQQ